MRRFSFKKVPAEEAEEEEDEEELHMFDGDYYYSRIPVTTAPPRPRRSFHRSATALTSALSCVNSRRSFSYDKLNQVPIQLTVFKLDDSSFEIDVTKMATIAELKLAVERAFSHLPSRGPGKISWRHVWGHFCLSHCGRKLLNGDDFIKDYGIRDGDQLRFVRHVSTAYNLIKKQSRKRIEAPKPNTIPENHEEESQKVVEVYDEENLQCQLYKYEVDQDNSNQNECLFTHLFRGSFLYSRLSSREHQKSDEDTGLSRWASGFAGCFRSLFHFCDNNKSPSYPSRVSQVEI